MKQLLLTTILVAAISLLGSSQTFKFGHIDSQTLLQAMPEQETAKVTLEKEFKQMENNLQSMQVELNKKYEAYMGAYDTLSDFVKKSKEQEMQEIQTNTKLSARSTKSVTKKRS
ncbi:MAG: OmpH family outer membrane protein [Bacteroidales bacterium]|nr:OmpH family outer membrane protein [Bacteroidales bacterium]